METAHRSRSEAQMPSAVAGKNLRLAAFELQISGGASGNCANPAIAQVKPVAKNRLREGDRVFASLAGGDSNLAWLEVQAVHADGYEAKPLNHSQGKVVWLNRSGVGEIDGAPVEVQAVDTGHRLNPERWKEALDNYRAFRSLGLTLPLERFQMQMRVSTNQIHLNAHPQAIATLSLGQYFVCGQAVWLVIENGRDVLLGQRMDDHHSAEFTRKGECTTNPAWKIEAAILSEADYDHEGWKHEIEVRGSELPALPLFDMAPGALNEVLPGSRILLSALMTGRESEWEVISVSKGGAEIRHGSDIGTIDFTTGQGEGAAVSASFRAVILSPKWCHGDLGQMFEKVLFFV